MGNTTAAQAAPTAAAEVAAATVELASAHESLEAERNENALARFDLEDAGESRKRHIDEIDRLADEREYYREKQQYFREKLRRTQEELVNEECSHADTLEHEVMYQDHLSREREKSRREREKSRKLEQGLTKLIELMSSRSAAYAEALIMESFRENDPESAARTIASILKRTQTQQAGAAAAGADVEVTGQLGADARIRQAQAAAALRGDIVDLASASP